PGVPDPPAVAVGERVDPGPRLAADLEQRQPKPPLREEHPREAPEERRHALVHEAALRSVRRTVHRAEAIEVIVQRLFGREPDLIHPGVALETSRFALQLVTQLPR